MVTMEVTNPSVKPLSRIQALVERDMVSPLVNALE